jgi:heptosyltransferase-2
MPSRVIVLSPNWLGDAVMALGALGAVRRAHPADTLIVAARRPLAPLFHLVPDVDEVVEFEGSGGGARGGRSDADRLGAARPDIAILLPNSLASAWAAWRAGVPERWGYRADARGPLLTRSVPRPRGSRHQSDYYRELVAALGMETGGPPSQVVAGAELRARAAQVLADVGCAPGVPLVGIAPGAAYGRAKQWPPERYAALIIRLAAESAATAVMVGNAGDQQAGATIERSLEQEGVERIDRASGRARWVNLIGRTDLPLAAAVMMSCRAFVSNDSGAMHLAAAAGVTVVAIFGPTIEEETAPLPFSAHTILTAPVWCRPCMLRECPIDHRCMTGVTVEQVAQAVHGIVCSG